MTNKKRGEVKIKIGNKDRVLKLTLNDFAELQDMHDGRPLMDILESLDRMDIKVLRSLLCLALRHSDPDITEADVGDLDVSVGVVIDRLGKCITASLGAGKSTEKK